MMQPVTLKEDADVDQIHQFWKEFHLFPLRIERWGLKYWYLLMVMPYVAVLVLIVVIGYLDVELKLAVAEKFTVSDNSTWPRIYTYVREEFLKDYIFNLTGIGFLLAGSAFVGWQARLEEFFRFILETISSKHSQINGDLHAKFYDFLNEYGEKLESKKRYIVVIGMTLLVILPAILVRHFFHVPTSLVGWVYYLEELIKWVGTWLIWAYCLGICGWATYATASSISKLPNDFEFNLIPSHPDRSAGLKPVGKFCLLMVSPILISILYLTIFGVLTNMNLPILQTFQPPVVTRVINVVVLFMIAIPLATFVFLKTLWTFHIMMLDKRRDHERLQRVLISGCLADLQLNLENNDIAAAKISSEKLDLIRKMDTDIGFPVWPFDRKILVRFATPQLLSGIGYLAVFIRGKILH